MKQLNEEVIQWKLSPLRGRFWEPDFDFELDDHRHAGALVHPGPPPSSMPRRSTPSLTPNPAPARQSSSPPILKATPSPRRIRAPLKSCWKGSLPPRRITPVATIGDYLVPALSGSSSPHHLDPVYARFQTPPVQVGPKPVRVGVESVSWSGSMPYTIRSWAGHPKRWLVNPTLLLASPLSYLDALMAGLRGRFRGRPGPGRVAPADHRGRGGNAAGSDRGTPDRSASLTAGHGGSPPAGAAAGRGGTSSCVG
jgi:hypothetical protein